MKLSLPEFPRTPRSRATRICIGKAVIELLNHKSFDEIRVTDIVSQAGVSRMTYYKYYGSKLEVLKDFLQEVILEYDAEQSRLYPDTLFEKQQIKTSIQFFERYAPMLQTFLQIGQHKLLIESILQYTSERVRRYVSLNDYQIYYYTGAVVGTYFRWIQKGRPESPDSLTDIIWNIINTPSV